MPLRVFEDLRRWHRRRKAIAEVGALSDRILKDIGVSRGSIRELVDARLRPKAETKAEAVAWDRRPSPVGLGFSARPCTQPC